MATSGVADVVAGSRLEPVHARGNASRVPSGHSDRDSTLHEHAREETVRAVPVRSDREGPGPPERLRTLRSQHLTQRDRIGGQRLGDPLVLLAQSSEHVA